MNDAIAIPVSPQEFLPMKGPRLQQDVLSTGQAARLLGLSVITIRKCLDTGLLAGFRVPGSRYRRVQRHVLLRFAREQGIPIEDDAEGVGTP